MELALNSSSPASSMLEVDSCSAISCDILLRRRKKTEFILGLTAEVDCNMKMRSFLVTNVQRLIKSRSRMTTSRFPSDRGRL